MVSFQLYSLATSQVRIRGYIVFHKCLVMTLSYGASGKGEHEINGEKILF
jgi:hypothetical protein